MSSQTSPDIEKRIDSLLADLEIDEKASMIAGADMWHSTGVERLGIPALKVTDGPNGARGSSKEGPTSACFPCGTALGATWNVDLVHRVGAALGEETRSKGAHILLAPTVNIHRSPLAGRNFECYSEDPHLTTRMAVAYITGVGSQGVGTSVKHFVCNDSEFERMSISSEVGERALREIYLPPFEAAVREAGTWSVMSAYNRINGTYASENPTLLDEILKKEWGFDGFVVSDWYGTKSTAPAANAGLDLEMPGPGIHMRDKLLEALKSGAVSEEVLDDKVRRLLRISFRAGAFDHSEEPEEQAIDKPEHRALARQAASEAIVMLRNEGALPLAADKLKTLAVIGPNADPAVIQGGGSANVGPHYAVTLLEAIRERSGDALEIKQEAGCNIDRTVPALDSRWVTMQDGEPGFDLQYFNGVAGLDTADAPALTKRARLAEFAWFGAFADEVDIHDFSARVVANFTPPETGRYVFALTSAGKSRLRIEGNEVVDNWDDQQRGDAFYGAGSSEVRGEIDLEAGRSVQVEVDYSRQDSPLLAGLKIGCELAQQDDLMERAVTAAATADAAVVVVGLTPEWESEGADRASLRLPMRQDELIAKVAAANPNTIVVVNAGSPVQMDWAEEVPAILQLWYPGQECGNALCDILFGDSNPSGRLPTTFPRRIEDNPAYTNYPGENGKVLYGEGIFVGYRYYDRKKIEPRFPFGHGLSYTHFDYANLRLDANEYRADPAGNLKVKVSVDVTNSGTRSGKEVVQLYLRDVASTPTRPEKELAAFAKVELAAGETQTVELELDRRALSFYDPDEKSWVAEAGEFEVLVGASSRDLRQRASFWLAD